MRLGLLGDSTTEVSYLPTSDTWAARLAALLGATVDNWGDSGKTTLDFLAGGSNRAWFTGALADYYIISFGYNDEDDYDSATFKGYTEQLVADVRTRGATPLLLTQPVVDYPDHSFTNPNPTIEEFNGRYAEVAAAQAVALIDLGQHIADKIAAGDWDWRIRRYALLDPPDNVITNPDVWDDTLDAVMEPIHGSLWYENIHGNLREQPERAFLIASYWSVSLGSVAVDARDADELVRLVEQGDDGPIPDNAAMGRTIRMAAGEERIFTCTVRDAAGVVADITGRAVYFAVRLDGQESNLFQHDNDAGSGITLTDPANGEATLTIDEASTAGQAAATGTWQCWTKDGSGVIKRLGSGRFVLDDAYPVIP